MQKKGKSPLVFSKNEKNTCMHRKLGEATQKTSKGDYPLNSPNGRQRWMKREFSFSPTI